MLRAQMLRLLTLLFALADSAPMTNHEVKGTLSPYVVPPHRRCEQLNGTEFPQAPSMACSRYHLQPGDSVVLAIGQMCEPAVLATRAAAVDALIGCMNDDAASYVRAAAVEVLSKIDREALAPQQADRIEKHLMGKCYARKAYEGKHGGGCA